MNQPSNEGEIQRLHALISAVMDGTADDAQRAELTERLRESEQARDQYLAFVDLHANLATDLVTRTWSSPETRSSQSDEVSFDAPSRRGRWIKVGGLVALAASSLLVVALMKPDQPSVEDESLGQVAQVTNAVWKSPPVFEGDRIGDSELQLESGFVRLQMDSGVEVTLEGPAEFKMVGASQAELNQGILTATVPMDAQGFTVNTPTAEVVDLGTAFGIDLRADGSSNVSVFDGEVEIGTRDSVEKRLLSEGESVRIGADYAMEDLQFDPEPFEKLWPIASGIVRSTDVFQFLPPWPRQIRFVTSDEDIFVAAEGHSVHLQHDVEVNVSQPGTYKLSSDLTPETIHRGKTVRSYLFHYAPSTPLGPRRARRIKGSITFDQPILGVILNNEELQSSSRWISRRNAGEQNQRRELNLSGDSTGDRVTLSDDSKTLTLDLVSPGRTSDLARVLVESRRGSRRRMHANRRNTTPPFRRNIR